jgi:regulator of replication initiation timing
VEEVAIEVMQTNKAIELFTAMAIVSMNIGNLNLEVNNLKNRLATKEKEKAILQVELNKEKDFKREYKHNINI